MKPDPTCSSIALQATSASSYRGRRNAEALRSRAVERGTVDVHSSSRLEDSQLDFLTENGVPPSGNTRAVVSQSVAGRAPGVVGSKWRE